MSTLSQFVGGGGAVKSVQRGSINLYSVHPSYGFFNGGIWDATANITQVNPAKSIVLISVTTGDDPVLPRAYLCRADLINGGAQVYVAHGANTNAITVHYQVIEYV